MKTIINNTQVIMKKYIIIAAAAIAAMACSKVETNDSTPDVKVTFQAANYVPQTKAGTEVSVWSDFKAFKSRAFMHAEGIDLNSNGTVKTGNSNYQEFFGASGETISAYTSAGVVEATTQSNVAYWAPSHTYYWPKGEYSFVNFVGWYGTTGTAASDPTVTYYYDGDTSKWTAKMEWTFSNSTAGAAGANLLYADMAWRYKANDTNPQYGVSGASEGVPMLFHHALAQINVKAYAINATGSPALTAGTDKVTESGVAEWVITLEDVTITPIHQAGKLTITNADPVPEGTPGTAQTQVWSGGWDGTDTAGDFTASNKIVDQVSAATAEDVIAATCVLPQDVSAVALNFNMRIQTTYLGTGAGQTNTELIPVSIPIGTSGGFNTAAWEQNHKYTYYIKIVPSQNKVLFDPALDQAWIDVPASGTTEKEI